MPTAAVILNPTAGSTGGRLSPERVRSLMEARGFSVEILPTTGPGSAPDLARRAAERHPIVAAAGGDGTVHEVATGLLGTDAALALLPGGSGDDFAWGVGIRSAEAGAKAAGAGHVRRIDVGWLGDKPFINTAGLFLSGQVSERAQRVWFFAGRFRYTLAALHSLMRRRGQEATWQLHGESEPRRGAWLLAEISNGPRAGGGFRLAPDADPSDGLLDFALIGQVGLGALARIFPAAARGERFSHPAVHRPRSRSAVLTLPKPAAIHRDGEAGVLPAGQHHFHLEPGRLRLLAPASGQE